MGRYGSGFGIFSSSTGGGTGITGGGTVNYVAKFVGATSIGNSIMQGNGTVMTIGGAPVNDQTLTVISSVTTGLLVSTDHVDGIAVKAQPSGRDNPVGFEATLSSDATAVKKAFDTLVTGTGTTNIGIDLSVSGGTLNYAINVSKGDVVTAQVSTRIFSGAGTHITKLGGNLSTDLIDFQSNAGTTIMEIRGDNTVYIPTGYLGVGYSALGAGFGGHKVSVLNNTAASSFISYQTGGNGKAFEARLTATGGSQYGLYVSSTTSNVNVNASFFNVTGGGGGAKNAIWIGNGTIEMPAAGAIHGCKIGTAATQILSFWGATPIGQPTALTAADATATDGTIGTADTIINNLRVRVDELEAKLSAAGGGSGLIA